MPETRSDPGFVETIPIFRMFDIEATRRFYLDFLGFAVAWEHRFEPSLPLYIEIRRGDLTLHLTQHHGDATPGSAVFVVVDDIEDLHAALDPSFPFARPGVDRAPWGARTVTLIDPSGNRLTFNEYDPEIQASRIVGA